MARLRQWLPHSGNKHPGAQDAEGVTWDPETEGRLDPNTAALMEGAPPAGADGRTQPVGETPDPRPARGPGEGEVQNLAG